MPLLCAVTVVLVHDTASDGFSDAYVPPGPAAALTSRKLAAGGQGGATGSGYIASKRPSTIVVAAVCMHVCSAATVAAHDVRTAKSASVHFAIVLASFTPAAATAPVRSVVPQSVAPMVPLSSLFWHLRRSFTTF